MSQPGVPGFSGFPLPSRRLCVCLYACRFTLILFVFSKAYVLEPRVSPTICSAAYIPSLSLYVFDENSHSRKV